MTLAANDRRLQQPKAFEVPESARGNSRPRAELLDGQLLLLRRQRSPLPAPALLHGRRKLLADHAERQELVPLQPEDRLQTVDIVIAEQPVAAGRPPRGQEPLILEVA